MIDRLRLQRVLPGAILAVIVLLAGIAVLAGAPIVLLLCATALPWLFLLGSRTGAALAVVAVLLSSLLLLLGVLMVTPVLPAGTMVPALVGVWVLIGLLGSLACWRRRESVRLPSGRVFGLWLPALLGGIVWCGAVLHAAIQGGAARLSWVMQGDSANNLLFAREVIYRNGVGIGPTENPVPLPSALLALAMAPGRGDVSSGELLEHDLESFVHLWSLCIVIAALVVGAAAASIVERAGARSLVVSISSGLGSTLLLTWYFTGYPIEFGFFNTHVSLLVVFAGFIAFLHARAHPVTALVVLLFSATLLLAIWSPLVLLPAALGLVLVFGQWRAILATRGLALALLVIGVVQVVLYGLVVVLPGLLSQSAFLSAPGGAYDFRHWISPGLAIVAAGLALVTFRSFRGAVVRAVLAIAGGSMAGLGMLLFISRGNDNPWSYYPVKFAWLVSIILTVMIAALVVAFFARLTERLWVQLLGTVLATLGTLLFMSWAPGSAALRGTTAPVPAVYGGHFNGASDEAVDAVLTLSDTEQAAFLWSSRQPSDDFINFWLMMMWSDSTTENFDLRAAAYLVYDKTDPAELCRLNSLMGGSADVYTSDPAVVDEVEEYCGGSGPRVVLE